MEPHQHSDSHQQAQLEKSIKETGWSEYMSFVVDPVIFEEKKHNQIRIWPDQFTKTVT